MTRFIDLMILKWLMADSRPGSLEPHLESELELSLLVTPVWREQVGAAWNRRGRESGRVGRDRARDARPLLRIEHVLELCNNFRRRGPSERQLTRVARIDIVAG